MRIEHVLVATDLSPSAQLACVHAAEFAKRFGARVTLLHVTERLDLSFLPSHDVVRHAEEQAEEARRKLEEAAAYFAENGCPCGLQTTAGKPAEEILHFVEQEHADLCVLTRHGHHRPARLFVGSTARRVLRHIHTPFLLVPPLAEDASPPPFAGYTRILTTTDYGEDSRAGLDVAVALAEAFEARVTLTHVARLPGGLVGVSEVSSPVRLPTDTVTWLRDHHAERLEALAAETGSERVDGHLGIDNSPSAGIVAASVSVGADLIVVPSHGKGAFRAILVGSTSERVLDLARVPVLVLPRPWLELQT